MHISFHGAAGGVTGSKHIVEIGGKKLLLDCGMYQGKREEANNLNRHFPFEPSEIDAVVLSHAHIDHSGLLPMLVKQGFTGKIHCTAATRDLLGPMLLDAAHIQEADAELFMRKERLKKIAVLPIEPLFTRFDAELTLRQLEPHGFQEAFSVMPGAMVSFYHAGHILGSAQVLIEAEGKKLVFTGDYGRKQRKIIEDPDIIPAADAVITESTYGGRLHPPFMENRFKLLEVVKKTAARGGKLIIPSFALERTQELLFDLHQLVDENLLPEIPVFVDSPLATQFTNIFARHEASFAEEARAFFLDKGEKPFSFARLRHTADVEESKSLNSRRGPFIVISGSGMCEGGRIRHHLLNSLPFPENTVLFVGYQAADTLGRKLVEGNKLVKIFDETVPVRASIEVINGYSGHGDQNDLTENLVNMAGLKKIFIVHGDPDQQAEFATHLHQTNPDWDLRIPAPGETYPL